MKIEKPPRVIKQWPRKPDPHHMYEHLKSLLPPMSPEDYQIAVREIARKVGI